MKTAAFLAPDVKGATEPLYWDHSFSSCCKVHHASPMDKFSAFLHSTSSLSFLFFHLMKSNSVIAKLYSESSDILFNRGWHWIAQKFWWIHAQFRGFVFLSHKPLAPRLKVFKSFLWQSPNGLVRHIFVSKRKVNYSSFHLEIYHLELHTLVLEMTLILGKIEGKRRKRQ